MGNPIDPRSIEAGFSIERVARGPELAGFFSQAAELLQGYQGVVIPTRSQRNNGRTAAGVPIVFGDDVYLNILKNHKRAKEIQDDYADGEDPYEYGILRDPMRLKKLNKIQVVRKISKLVPSLAEPRAAAVSFLEVLPHPYEPGAFSVEAQFDNYTDGNIWAEREAACRTLAMMAGLDPGEMDWIERPPGFLVAHILPDFSPALDHTIDPAIYLNTNTPELFANSVADQLDRRLDFDVMLDGAVPPWRPQ